MNHVFAETNFLVDLLRPLPAKDAVDLFERIGKDVTLHIPWVSVSEAKRTIPAKISRDDLGFADLVGKFGVKLLESSVVSTVEMKVIQEFGKHINK